MLRRPAEHGIFSEFKALRNLQQPRSHQEQGMSHLDFGKIVRNFASVFDIDLVRVFKFVVWTSYGQSFIDDDAFL